MRNLLNQTPTGRNAMYVYDRDNVQFVDGVAGQGNFFTPPDGKGGGNTVTIDPKDQTAACSLVHEMNHADVQHSGLTPDPTKMSKADYVNAAMREDAHGEVLAQKEHNELAAAGDPEAGERMPATGGVYNAAAQRGADDYKAAHPDATQDEIDAAGEKAGEDRVFKSYQDGKVTQSTNDPVTGKHETYNNSLGQDLGRCQSRETLGVHGVSAFCCSPHFWRWRRQHPHRSRRAQWMTVSRSQPWSSPSMRTRRN